MWGVSILQAQQGDCKRPSILFMRPLAFSNLRCRDWSFGEQTHRPWGDLWMNHTSVSPAACNYPEAMKKLFFFGGGGCCIFFCSWYGSFIVLNMLVPDLELQVHQGILYTAYMPSQLLFPVAGNATISANWQTGSRLCTNSETAVYFRVYFRATHYNQLKVECRFVHTHGKPPLHPFRNTTPLSKNQHVKLLLWAREELWPYRFGWLPLSGSSYLCSQGERTPL